MARPPVGRGRHRVGPAGRCRIARRGLRRFRRVQRERLERRVFRRRGESALLPRSAWLTGSGDKRELRHRAGAAQQRLRRAPASPGQRAVALHGVNVVYKNLLIVGGGFAGTKAAQMLEHTLPPDWTLTLINQENFVTFNPLLPEVVGASILPGHVVAPHRLMIHCTHVFMAEVTEIDTVQRVVHYLGEGTGTLPYDQLVLACGTSANIDIVKGMGTYALPLKTLGDALFLRNRVIERLEQAELQPDEQQRRWLLSFIVVGGGFSGVETAGELVDFLCASLRYYKRIRLADLYIAQDAHTRCRRATECAGRPRQRQGGAPGIRRSHQRGHCSVHDRYAAER